MAEQSKNLVVAWCYPFPWGHQALFVAQLPGDGGVDWGYTHDEKQAIPLNRFHFKRFAKYQRDLGRVAFCTPYKAEG